MCTVSQDGVKFDINNEGTLVGMWSKKKSVFIPKKVKGVIIQAIGNRFCKDYIDYDKIAFDNSIDIIYSSAFEGASVKEVVWPSACDEIPYHCFYDSNVLKVSNTDNVVAVGPSAFEGSDIREFVWPSHCDRIPSRCFSRTDLKKISNIDGVVAIGEYAFSSTKLEEFTVPSGVEVVEPCTFLCSEIRQLSWSESCPAIPHHCFGGCSRLEKIEIPDCVRCIGDGAFASCGVKKIRWPDSCEEVPMGCFNSSKIEEITNISHIAKIGAGAFAGSSLKRLDLSALPVCTIGEKAFGELERGGISFPYYWDVKEIGKYF